MLKTTQENKMSASCTRESGLLKKPTEGQLTVSFFSIPHPATNFRYVLCNPWDVNYPASHLSKWANLAPTAGREVFLFCISSLRFRSSRIPPLVFTVVLYSPAALGQTCVGPWKLWCALLPVAFAIVQNFFFFILYATPNLQLVCNSNYKLGIGAYLANRFQR